MSRVGSGPADRHFVSVNYTNKKTQVRLHVALGLAGRTRPSVDVVPSPSARDRTWGWRTMPLASPPGDLPPVYLTHGRERRVPVPCRSPRALRRQAPVDAS
jgi:hypothetical protein